MFTCCTCSHAAHVLQKIPDLWPKSGSAPSSRSPWHQLWSKRCTSAAAVELTGGSDLGRRKAVAGCPAEHADRDEGEGSHLRGPMGGWSRCAPTACYESIEELYAVAVLQFVFAQPIDRPCQGLRFDVRHYE